MRPHCDFWTLTPLAYLVNVASEEQMQAIDWVGTLND
jgi:hypothetical protein